MRVSNAAGSSSCASGCASSQDRSHAAAWARSTSASRRALGDPASRSRRVARSKAGPTSSARVRCIQVAEPSRLVGLQQRIDDAIEVALQQARKVVDGQPDTVVGDAVVGEVVGPNLLAALARADLRAALLAALRGLALLLRLEQPGTQHAHGLGPVLVLALLVLDGDDEPGGKVGDPHSRVGRVDALPAGTARPIDVDAEVLLIDLDLDLVCLRQDRYGRRRGMNPALSLGGRHALHAVHTGLELQARVGAVAAHLG